MAAVRSGALPSIRTLWGLAKSPELTMDEDTLYAIIYRETGKEQMRQLSQGEINNIARVLANMKDSAMRGQKRTDEGGNNLTVKLRRKIYMLTGELGWNNDNSRIKAFCKKMCGVDTIEWLSPDQCGVIIEALKKMVARAKEVT